MADFGLEWNWDKVGNSTSLLLIALSVNAGTDEALQGITTKSLTLSEQNVDLNKHQQLYDFFILKWLNNNTSAMAQL